MKLALLLSGSLGLKVLSNIYKTEEIAAILTDKNSVEISGFSKRKGIPCFIGNPRDGRASNFISKINIDLLLSVNYLFLVDKDVINWPALGPINFHGSLLPKYRGRTPHVWAIINNEKRTGITAHYMTEGCDEGDIIQQIEIPIEPNDSGAALLDKYHDIYPKLVRDVILQFSSNKINRITQDHSKATYFGKRTPADGNINWNWQKERIRNWVRAQSTPYPGAFSMINDKKVIIDWLEYDDHGFKQDQPNGLIMTVDPVRIKTPNGVVRLDSIREGRESIKKHEILK